MLLKRFLVMTGIIPVINYARISAIVIHAFVKI